MSELSPKNAKFSLGQIVYHSKFKYRGVIVDADPNFQGTDEWYESVATDSYHSSVPVSYTHLTLPTILLV